MMAANSGTDTHPGKRHEMKQPTGRRHSYLLLSLVHDLDLSFQHATHRSPLTPWDLGAELLCCY